MRMMTTTAMLIKLGLGTSVFAGVGARAQGAPCRAKAAASLVGKIAPKDATILRRTGSTIVRRIAPGDPVTNDYRAERITVAIVKRGVVSASCG